MQDSLGKRANQAYIEQTPNSQRVLFQPVTALGPERCLAGTKMNPNFRNFALWVIIILLVVALVMLFQNPGQRVPSQDIAFSQLLERS